MGKTSFDFSHLSVNERVQLAEDLWDSLADMQEDLPLTAAQTEELDRRREAYRQDRDPGTLWMEALREIEKPDA